MDHVIDYIVHLANVPCLHITCCKYSQVDWLPSYVHVQTRLSRTIPLTKLRDEWLAIDAALMDDIDLTKVQFQQIFFIFNYLAGSVISAATFNMYIY